MSPGPSRRRSTSQSPPGRLSALRPSASRGRLSGLGSLAATFDFLLGLFSAVQSRPGSGHQQTEQQAHEWCQRGSLCSSSASPVSGTARCRHHGELRRPEGWLKLSFGGEGEARRATGGGVTWVSCPRCLPGCTRGRGLRLGGAGEGGQVAGYMAPRGGRGAA